MMSNKLVTIPQRIADAINELRDAGMLSHNIVSFAVRGDSMRFDYLFQYTLNHMKNFVLAVYDGWEVELSPEDMVLQLYTKCDYVAYGSSNMLGTYRHAISATCTALGYKIKGVNM